MAKEKDMKSVQVVFNVLDEYQMRMFDFVSKKTNRSGYVKRLIQRDMEGGSMSEVKVIGNQEEINFSAKGFI